MTDIDPTSARAAMLERLHATARRLGAYVVTEEQWATVQGIVTKHRHDAILNSQMLATATQEATRMRELVLDICGIAGSLDDTTPLARCSTILGMAAEALNPDTLR